jgi:hypothetical protein
LWEQNKVKAIGTATTIGPTVPSFDNKSVLSIDGILTGRGTLRYLEKTLPPMSFHQPQIQHELPQD